MRRDYLKIRDFCEVFDGPHATPTKTDEGPFYLSISSLTRGTLDLSKSAHLSEQEFQKWTKRVTPRKGDLLFSYETRLGEAALMPDGIKACLGRRMGILRPDTKKVLPEYLLYSYIAPEFQNVITANTITGATVDRLSLTDFPDFEMRIPEIYEQRHIVAVLSALDAKISLNHRINVELEWMAKLLYDYWFVQYYFPLSAAQAAALGQPRLTGQPYRSSGGPMVFDPQLKREIPVIWSADNLLQLSDLGGGGTPNTKNQEYWSGHIPFFTPTDAEPQPFKLTTEQKITLKGLENSSTKVYPRGTLFVTVRGSVGKIMIIADAMAMNQSCYALCPHEGVNTPFLYFHALSLVNFLRTKSSGSIFKSIVTNDIKFSTTVIPDLETIECFGKIAEPLFSQILNNQQQNQELSTLRDWLLPMLMNGQVRVGCSESADSRQKGGAK